MGWVAGGGVVWEYVQHRMVIGSNTANTIDFGICEQSSNDVPIYGAKVYWADDWLTYPAGTLTCRVCPSGGDPTLFAQF